MIPLTDGTAADAVAVGAYRVHGLPVDLQTRCVHWHGPTDVVALALPCCALLHPCRDCHLAVQDHEPQRWPAARFDEHAILCGVCAVTMSIFDYLDVDGCGNCGAAFNPGCRLHRPDYFDEAGVAGSRHLGVSEAG